MKYISSTYTIPLQCVREMCAIHLLGDCFLATFLKYTHNPSVRVTKKSKIIHRKDMTACALFDHTIRTKELTIVIWLSL